MHTVFALLCFVVVIHWLILPYPSGLRHWHCGNLTIAPVPAKQPWWIWINTSCEFIMNDCITTTKQSTTKPYAYFLGYTVCRWKPPFWMIISVSVITNSITVGYLGHCRYCRDWMLQWSYRSEIWQAPRQQRCRGTCQISERLEKSKPESRGFETSRGLAVRHLTA